MRRLIVTLTLAALAICAAHCGDEISSDLCRLEPDRCGGGAGTPCGGDGDCDFGLICCLKSSNCGGGMCTIECRDDLDCPDDMACEHDVCFYRCSDDRDCAPGMSCEHGHTICEYP